MKTIDDVIQKLEYIMESDPRTFSNPECEYGWMFHKINEAIKMLKEIEKELPSAQPERKTGRWIYGEGDAGNDGYYCNACGNFFVPWIYEKFDIDFIRDFKFCPNCGAKMEGSEQE